MRGPETDERLSRLLERHRAVLASPESCQRLARRLTEPPRGGRLRWAAGIAWRLLLIYAFCSVGFHCLENSFPATSRQWRTGRALSYLNLLYLKSYRWLSVQLGFYRSEFLHSRDRESCLVPNPFYRPPVMCCGCRPVPASLPRVALDNPAGRDTFRRVVDSHVTPFLVTDSGHQPVSFAELRRTVLDAWEDVNSGSNRISVLAQQAADGDVRPATLSELMQPAAERPPPARLTLWIYGHQSAIRAIRRLVPRPGWVRPDIDYSFARGFYLLGGPIGEAVPLGDLSEFQGAAVLLGLHGGLRVTVAPKPECCPTPGDPRNSTAVLRPGQALVIPTQCYLVRAARDQDSSPGGDDGYSMAHLFGVFSSTGIKQAAPITGRVPESDDIGDDY